MVSTVGAYVHPRNSGGSEQAEAEWLKANYPGEDIGLDRKYETMVFECGEKCDCGCGGYRLADGNELGARGYMTADEATAGHMEMCNEWSTK